MKFGIVIVGDEILLGKRKDSHFVFSQQALKQHGLELSWCRIVGDDADELTQTYRETLATGDTVFSFGGIGATPDDRTRQCAASAMDIELVAHPEGLQLMQAKFKAALNERRQRLIEFPIGARLIPNPINQVPGFSLRNHHFVPGFPSMAHPMIEWVLLEYYTNHFKAESDIEKRLRVFNTPESELIPMMDQIIEAYPDIKLSSLPNTRRMGIVELGVRGESKAVIPAVGQLCDLLGKSQVRFSQLD